jgi:hypothetical protein
LKEKESKIRPHKLRSLTSRKLSGKRSHLRTKIFNNKTWAKSNRANSKNGARPSSTLFTYLQIINKCLRLLNSEIRPAVVKATKITLVKKASIALASEALGIKKQN